MFEQLHLKAISLIPFRLSVYLWLFSCVYYKKFLVVKKVGWSGLSYFFIL